MIAYDVLRMDESDWEIEKLQAKDNKEKTAETLDKSVFKQKRCNG